MKKKIQIIFVLVLGIILIYGINRVVTHVDPSDSAQSTTEDKKHSSTATTTTNTSKTAKLPKGSLDDWNLLLVGPDHPLKQDFPADAFADIPGTAMQLDKRVIQPFEELRDAAAKAGYPLVIISGYRSISAQQQVFDDTVAMHMAQGMSAEDAKATTLETVTEPGHSEHHTGLAVDIVDEDWNQNYPRTVLEEEYGEQPGAKWLAKHAREYGFIVRYPNHQEGITKITYEPWHFRYVGVAHAKYIEAHHLTLEEYLKLFKEK